MPELPEVETTRRGIEPHVLGQSLTRVLLRRPDLRWPIPEAVARELPGQRVLSVQRRAKYLLLETAPGSALIHLGMSGVLRVLPADAPVGRHDHVELHLASGQMLRLTDPRRFGCVLWQGRGEVHELLAALGPEPLGPEFSAEYLHDQLQRRGAAVKQVIMDAKVVVGVGNIYASEALFLAKVRPERAARDLSRAEAKRLHAAIVEVLSASIARGGTTLRDFLSPSGAPGYFEQELRVYGREGQPCRSCGAEVQQLVLGQRSTFYCPRCQS